MTDKLRGETKAARRQRQEREASERVRQQITRKPVPRDPGVWWQEYRGIEEHLVNLPKFEAAYGAAWVSSMMRYWRQRLADLRAFAPEGVKLPPTR